MNIQNLGIITGDILLFGGVYSNYAALNALLKTAGRLGIAAQNCICNGDIVAYCAEAEKCVSKIKDFGCPVVAGNCDVQLASNAPDCGCGFDEGSTCSILSNSWYTHALRNVSGENKKWLGTLPDRVLFTHLGQRYCVLHGGASDISRFIWPVTSEQEIAVEIQLLIDQVGDVDHVIAGHSGIPIQREIDAVSWTNIGAIGMPAHNAQQHTSYGVLSNSGIEIHNLNYDVDATVLAMKNAGLTQGYDQALLTGYWPSQDILPMTMRS